MPPIGPTAPGYGLIVNKVITEFLVQAADNVVVGRTYRLNVRVPARDCDGRKIIARERVQIILASC
jgi:hypothetical protein